MSPEELKSRLEGIFAKTRDAERVAVPGYWAADKADERRVLDDQRAGRLAWRAAHRSAAAGLRSLEAGDLESALQWLWNAMDCYVDALESRIEPSDVEFLSHSAQRRGRPKKSPR